ncbi:MAG TPA: chemotaxis protein CheA, partial [Novosphingobium sp.]|nr:chemotaxis protein CheA [Novosphingobium sp.]
MTADEIQAIFFAECEESLEAAEQGLAACRDGTQDSDTVNAVFRAVHSIKGGAGAFGYIALQGFTHTFETLLSDVRDGTVPITEPLIDLMLGGLDTLSDHVTAARDGGEPPEDAALQAEMTAAMAANAGAAPAAPVAAPAPAPTPDPAPVAETEQAGTTDSSGDDFDFDFDLDALLDDISDDIAPAADVAEVRWQVRVRPHAAAMRNGSEPLLMLREMSELGGTCEVCDISAIPQLDGFDVGTGYLGWVFSFPASVSEDSVRDIFDFVGDDCSLTFGVDAEMPAVQYPEAPVPAAPVATAPAIAAAAPPVFAAAPVPTASVAMPVEASAPADPEAARTAQANGSAPPAPPAPGQSIRIELGKLDKLIDAVGELVIAQAMMAQRLADQGLAVAEDMTMIEGLTRDIQESAMAIRAQPIGSVFSRVPRILRELASSTGKHVKLEVSGETTELDKTVIERLGEPLTHLIRNAVDHGIEQADERIAAGKPAEGTLTLSAEHRSGRILIRIGDDGKGIDRDRVFAKAVEKGLIAPDTVMSKEEIDLLIFAPGFSTAQTVTNVSGRGVGMDVVRQNVKDLGGRI